jgi:hypothetical protein
MPNYKQTTVSGESWQRCYSVTMRNPLEGAKQVVFAEETVVDVGGQQTRFPATGCFQAFDADGEFPLLDPVTGLQVGTATHAQVYALLYSLYMDTAAKRDATPEVYSTALPGVPG